MRWNQEIRIFPISVMSHLVITTFISYIIWSIENESWNNINIEDLMLRSIYHDIPEAITGDIIAPTKKAISWFSEILEKVEINMMNDYIFSYVESNYKEQVYNYMLKPFDWELWKIAKQADMLSALFEAKIEISYWWKNYSEIYKDIKKILNDIWTKSVDYILKNWIDSFDERFDSINLNNDK
jgi:putative hydrolase of HD superfamily